MYRSYYNTRQTPQSEPIPNTDQVKNSAGGYAWAIDDWTRLDRFLILGSDEPTYYSSARTLTIENADAVQRCIKADGTRTVNRIVEISEGGRAPKNDPALFALAMCCAADDAVTRKTALDALPRVARIGTHLFHFLHYVEGFRGWGRGLRNAVGAWYSDKPADKLAYQVVKYRQRDGWTHRDALRLAHPVPAETHQALFHWIAQGKAQEGLPDHVIGFERMQVAETTGDVLATLADYPHLPWETIPTQFLKERQVWEVLLPRLPMAALFRNLARMTANGLIKPLSDAAHLVAERIGDGERILTARVHPIQVLAALTTYQSGQGVRGKLTWDPVSEVVDALDAAFYLAFGNVEPTGKRTVIGLDVSGSMNCNTIVGIPGLTPRVGAAAMAMVTARVEKQCAIMAFSREFIPFEVSPRERLDDIVRRADALPFGGTDCSLPMLWAMKHQVPADAFMIYTDSATWAGKIHPRQALQEHRRRTGIPAKLVVVGMVSNGFTIADPNDGGMLDVVGFDTATPNIISGFVRQ